MSESRYDSLVASLCYEIDLLKAELEETKELADFYKKQHMDLVNSSIKHSQEMMGNIVTAILSPEKFA